jgi:kynurenine formamidase
MKIIDLSQPILSGMPVYPGDSPVRLTQTRFLASDYHNNFQLEISMHVGTHIDGPRHLLHSDLSILELPLDRFMGQGCLLDVSGEREIHWKSEYKGLVPENSIVLLYSGHDQFYGTPRYFQGYPRVTLEFAQELITRNTKLLGLDWPSPDVFPFHVHKALLAENIYIIENLTNLQELLGHSFEVCALPLKLKADSALVRAAARLK